MPRRAVENGIKSARVFSHSRVAPAVSRRRREGVVLSNPLLQPGETMRPRALLAAAVILGASTIRAQEVRQQNKTFVVRSTTPAENWTAALRLAHFQAIAG